MRGVLINMFIASYEQQQTRLLKVVSDSMPSKCVTHTLITFCHKVAYVHLQLGTLNKKTDTGSPVALQQRHLKDVLAQ